MSMRFVLEIGSEDMHVACQEAGSIAEMKMWMQNKRREWARGGVWKRQSLGEGVFVCLHSQKSRC